jgi:hypothetical protein
MVRIKPKRVNNKVAPNFIFENDKLNKSALYRSYTGNNNINTSFFNPLQVSMSSLKYQAEENS